MEIPRALGQAELQMRGAREALQGRQPGQAAESQGQALDQMQQGGQAMMEQLQQQMANQPGQGPGEQPQGQAADRPRSARPLGAQRGRLGTKASRCPRRASSAGRAACWRSCTAAPATAPGRSRARLLQPPARPVLSAPPCRPAPLPSPNWDERPPGQPVDLLVLHYTGMASGEAALERLCDPAAKVSAHYLIDEDGTVVALVPEAMRAWHAGRSAWAGRAGSTTRSVGIEIVNPGHEWGYRPFPAAQIAALVELGRGIMERWPIPAWSVVGHSDIAPDRKEDPGELFDWRAWRAAGIGVWPGGDRGPGRRARRRAQRSRRHRLRAGAAGRHLRPDRSRPSSAATAEPGSTAPLDPGTMGRLGRRRALLRRRDGLH